MENQTPLRYSAAACQVDFESPKDCRGIRTHVDRMLEMIDHTVAGHSHLLPVKLVVFPEFAHAAPIYPSATEFVERLAVPIPNEHTERYAVKARELDIWVQTGTFLERDERYPGLVFNTTCLIGPSGIEARYRKVHPWIPWEFHASPHDLPGYSEELFPVVDTAIGKLGAAICYDWLFPEAIRQLAAAGAEVLIGVSAYQDPWGTTSPTDRWTVINRCRAIENMAYVVASNRAAQRGHYPLLSRPGGSMVVDYDGRIVAQADPGPGERIVVAPIDITALRHERTSRQGHQGPAHMRTEAYSAYRRSFYPPWRAADPRRLSPRGIGEAIDLAKGQLGYDRPAPREMSPGT